MDNNSSRSLSWLRHQTNDIVLRIIALVVLAIGIFLRFVDASQDSHASLGFFGLGALIAGLVYAILMATVSAREHFEKQKEALNGGAEEDETVNTHVERRMTEYVESSIGQQQQQQPNDKDIASVDIKSNKVSNKGTAEQPATEIDKLETV
jgi:hypothetical protein